MSAKLSNPKNLIALVLVGVVVVVAGAWFLLVSPERSKVGTLDDQIASVQKQIDERQAALRNPAADVHVRAADVYRLNRAMPDQVDMPGIIVTLNQLAVGHDLAFTSISPNPVVTQNGFNVQPIAVTMQGRFGDVSKFLADVRNLVRVKKHALAASGRLFSIDSVDFAEADNKKLTFPNVKATLTIDAFTFVGGNLTTTPSTPSAPSGSVAAGAKP